MTHHASESTAVPVRSVGIVALLMLGIVAGAATATALRAPLVPKSERTTSPPHGSADEWLGIGGACRPPGAGT